MEREKCQIISDTPVYADWPPDIDYEELARKAGYSEEEIEEMFETPYIKQFQQKRQDPSPLDPVFNMDIPF